MMPGEHCELVQLGEESAENDFGSESSLGGYRPNSQL